MMRPPFRLYISHLVEDYEMARGFREQANGFIKLIEASKHKYSLSKKALKGLNKLKNCGEIQYRRMPNEFIKEYIIKCHHPCCHKCDDYDRTQVAFDMLEKVEALFPDGKIIRDQVSWVTINFSKSELGSDLSSIHKDSKSDIDTLIKRKLPNVGLVGHFQNAIQEDINSDNYNGSFHAHFIAIHPYNKRNELRKVLRSKYPKKTDIHIDPFSTKQDIDFAVCVACYYAADLTTKRVTYGEDTSDVYSKYLNSLESIRSGGRRGYRFDPGYNRLLKSQNEIWKKDKDERLARMRKRLSARKPVVEVNECDNVCLENECIRSELSDTKFPSVLAMLNHYSKQLVNLGKQVMHQISTTTTKAIRNVSTRLANTLLLPSILYYKRE